MEDKDDKLIKCYQDCFLAEDTKCQDEAAEAIYNKYAELVLDLVKNYLYWNRIEEVERISKDDMATLIVELEDIIHEIWKRIFAQLQRNAQTGKIFERDFNSWVEGLVRKTVNNFGNVIWDMRRNRRSFSDMDTQQAISQSTTAEDLESVDQIIERYELSDSTLRALNSLSKRERAFVVAHYLQDIPVEKIAAHWGVSIGTVYRDMNNARKKMGKVLL